MTKNGDCFSQQCKNKTAVILTSRNRLEMIKEAIRYINESGDTDLFDLYIVDSNSTDGTAEWLFENMRNKATLIFDEDETMGYAECNNRVMKMCSDYEFIYLLNNDCYVEPYWLSAAIECARRNPEAGHIASKQLNRDFSIQAAGAFKSREGETVCAYTSRERDYPPANEEYEVDYGGFGLYRTSLLKELGYLEEGYWPIYFDDDDWGLKVEQAGYSVLYCPKSELRHMMNPTNREHHRGAVDRNLVLFQSKWGEYLKTRGIKIRPGAIRKGIGYPETLPKEWFGEE